MSRLNKNRKNVWVALLILTIFPLFLGLLLYAYVGQHNLILYDWFNLDIGFPKNIILVEEFPSWVINYLPDCLWAFSFTSLLFCIWQNESLRIKITLLNIPFLTGCIFELGQKYHLINGTFDLKDILTYIVGIALSRLINFIVNKHLALKLYYND